LGDGSGAEGMRICSRIIFQDRGAEGVVEQHNKFHAAVRLESVGEAKLTQPNARLPMSYFPDIRLDQG